MRVVCCWFKVVRCARVVCESIGSRQSGGLRGCWRSSGRVGARRVVGYRYVVGTTQQRIVLGGPALSTMSPTLPICDPALHGLPLFLRSRRASRNQNAVGTNICTPGS